MTDSRVDDNRSAFDAAPYVQPMPVRENQKPSPENKLRSEQTRLKISDWSAAVYDGDLIEREWLIQDVIPLGGLTMLASAGGLGKSFIALQLAFEVAYGQIAANREGWNILGGKVVAHGRVVFLTAEDDKPELQRRLFNLDPERTFRNNPDQLYIIPCLDVGQVPLVLKEEFGVVSISKVFEDLAKQLIDLGKLTLIVIDPLQVFAGVDVNKSPFLAQTLNTALAALAKRTGATVLVTHHTRKDASSGGIKTSPQARDAVRGSSALVDGVRCAIVLWQASEEDRMRDAKLLRRCLHPGHYAKGSVVKSNAPVNRAIQSYVRNDFGLLKNVTDELTTAQNGNMPNELHFLAQSIAEMARNKRPFTKTGKKGLYERRLDLEPSLQGLGRDHLIALCEDLLNKGRIVKNQNGFLDAPGGEIATDERDQVNAQRGPHHSGSDVPNSGKPEPEC